MNKFEKAALQIIEAYNCYTVYKNKTEWNTPGLITVIHATPEDSNEPEPWGFISLDADGINIVFRGTDSIFDWINNSELSEGWDKLYSQFSTKLLQLLSVNINNVINVYGHSAGCCLAKRLIRDLPKQVNSALIAAPKDTLRVSCDVVNNEHDVVPKAPELLENYSQCGNITQVSFFHFDLIKCHSIYNYKLKFQELGI